jgi:hypothetical protein
MILESSVKPTANSRMMATGIDCAQILPQVHAW